MTAVSYEDVVNSQAFQSDLAGLNQAVADSLITAGEPAAINGNVCYGHMVEDFHLGPMEALMEPKRRALHQLAQESHCFVEVGVAAGHAALLALYANPSLTYIGIDLAQRLRPSWPPVQIYVPAAFNWLRTRFPDRVKLYETDALSGLAQVAKEQQFGPVDLIHLDAQKNTRVAEVDAIWPGLAGRAYLMQGDNKNGHVKASSAQLIAEGRGRAVSSSRHVALQTPFYDVLEIGPDVQAGRISLDSLANDRILVCVCHQDDETLFCGSTLARLKGKADVTVASFFRPAPGRRDTDTREAAMQRVCDTVGARRIQYPFAAEQDQARLRRFIRMPEQASGAAPELARPLRRHPLFGLLSGTAFALMQQVRPTTIITHNRVGEYGHIEHVMLHHSVLHAAQRYQADRVLTFGQGMPETDLVVASLTEEKNRLYDEYLPQWNGRGLYDFALDDESFVQIDMSAPLETGA